MHIDKKAALDTRLRSAHRLSRSLAHQADEAYRVLDTRSASALYRRAARLEEEALGATEGLARAGHDYGPLALFLARSTAWLYHLAGDAREHAIVERYGEDAFFHATYDKL